LTVAISREEGSIGMRLATAALKLRGKPLANPDSFRSSILNRTCPSPAPIPHSFKTRYSISEEQVQGHRVLTVAPRTGATGPRIIYLHGGAYVNEMSKPHWDIIKSLIEATGATVSVPIYPLAPEFNHRAAYPFLIEVYRRILTQTEPANIVLAGDSAGGGLALGMVIEFRTLGLPQPSRIVLFSPWLDLTLADRAALDVEPRDVMLGIQALRQCGIWWAAGDDARLPRLSPLYADMQGLPPISLFQGTRDIFVIDSQAFAAKVKNVGGAIDYVQFPGAFHVFVGATFTSEAKQVFGRIAATLQTRH
jgi:monoterpene epsilon-lactone hydrolase